MVWMGVRDAKLLIRSYDRHACKHRIRIVIPLFSPPFVCLKGNHTAIPLISSTSYCSTLPYWWWSVRTWFHPNSTTTTKQCYYSCECTPLFISMHITLIRVKTNKRITAVFPPNTADPLSSFLFYCMCEEINITCRLLIWNGSQERRRSDCGDFVHHPVFGFYEQRHSHTRPSLSGHRTEFDQYGAGHSLQCLFGYPAYQ